MHYMLDQTLYPKVVGSGVLTQSSQETCSECVMGLNIDATSTAVSFACLPLSRCPWGCEEMHERAFIRSISYVTEARWLVGF